MNLWRKEERQTLSLRRSALLSALAIFVAAGFALWVSREDRQSFPTGLPKFGLPSTNESSKAHHGDQAHAGHRPCSSCHADSTPEGETRPKGQTSPKVGRRSKKRPPVSSSQPYVETSSLIEPLEPGTTLERYPTLDAPDNISVEENFAVQVSLATTQTSVETHIVAGKENDGRLVLNLPGSERTWQIEVDLTAPGFDFVTGSSNSQVITLSRDGDSTIALFHLRARAFTGPSKSLKLYATFYHDDAFIARVERPLTVVTNDSEALPGRARVSPSTATAGPVEAKKSVSLTIDPKDPTLTIEEVHYEHGSYLLLHSKYYGYVSAEMPDADKLRDWVKQRLNEIAQVGRGLSVGAAQPTSYASDLANGFGIDLYDKFAPPAFKKLFWDLYDEHSTNFSSIQVISDDPVLPWELMRPARSDGSERQQFLGLSFKIARWHIRSEALPRPSQIVVLSTLAVIAPNYEAPHALPAVGDEVKALSSLPKFTAIGGDYESVRNLATHLPDGIVHFAGHGATRIQQGVPEFLILLQDVELAPSTWKSLISAHPTTHTLFFFNACEVGEAQQFMNEVEGWAPTLLDTGASGYIGALWPIADKVAAQFASEFYRGVATQLRQGKADVAQLLAATRLKVYKKTKDPTALAYVLYGDPESVIVLEPLPAPNSPASPRQ